jgi:hypothetical protein
VNRRLVVKRTIRGIAFLKAKTLASRIIVDGWKQCPNLESNRLPSSLISTMEPYTPRPGGRKKNLTLSVKEYTKVREHLCFCFRSIYTCPRSLAQSRPFERIDTLRATTSTRMQTDTFVPRATAEIEVRFSPFYPYFHCYTALLLGPDEPSFIAETSFVRAPLNSRVGSNPIATKAKGKAKQDTLDHMPLDIQEAIILEDLLYVLMVRYQLCFGFLSLTLHLKGYRGNIYHISS